MGPSTLIAAAFIGPGTVTVCSLAGITFGYDLLWAMVLAIVATIFLQEMSARLGLITNKDLATMIRIYFTSPWKKTLAIFLVIVAIVIGNTAYEAGNITGAAWGISAVVKDPEIQFSNFKLQLFPILIGGLALLVLALDSYARIEKILLVLVISMSLSFVVAVLLISPNWAEVVLGIFTPQIPEHSLLHILAIVGTTVVPYNLFLHASLVQEKWNSPKDLIYARWDLVIAIGLGGLVSMCIIIAGAALHPPAGDASVSITDLAHSLTPLYGEYATYLLSFGFFAAGITSTITAALAAAYVLKSSFGWNGKTGQKRFAWVWASIIVIGVFFSSLGIRPLHLIQTAQISNAVVLPFTVVILYTVVNSKKWMGSFVNTPWQKAVGILILLWTIFLSFKSIALLWIQ